MTELACLDGPGTAAVGDQLVAVYRAAMAAPPFFESEVETGWFAQELAGELTEAGFRCWVAGDGDRTVGFAYGFPTPEVPSDGWYGSLREAVGPDAADHWLVGQFAVVWIAVTRTGEAEGSAAGCWSGCSPAPLPTGPGWSPTTWTPRPAPSTAPWASGSWAAAPSAGTTPNGSSWAPTSPRAGLNPPPARSGGSRRCRRRPGRRRRTW
jgi:hypothetical protein